MTSSIRITRVLPRLVGKTIYSQSRYTEHLRGFEICNFNHTLYFVHYDAYFFIKMTSLRSLGIFVRQFFIVFHY